MHFGHPRTTTAFKNQNFLKIWVFQGFSYTRLGPDLAIFCKDFEIFRSKMAQSGVWQTLKNPNFEEISIFEGCVSSRMPKMHSGGV